MPGRKVKFDGTPPSTANVTVLPDSRSAWPRPSSVPIASPSGETCVTIMMRVAVFTSWVALLHSIVGRVLWRGRWCGREIERVDGVLYSFGTAQGVIPVKVQDRHAAQTHTLADFTA